MSSMFSTVCTALICLLPTGSVGPFSKLTELTAPLNVELRPVICSMFSTVCTALICRDDRRGAAKAPRVKMRIAEKYMMCEME